MLIAMTACVALVLGTILLHYEVLRVTANHIDDLPIAPRFRIVPVVIAAFVGHTLQVWLYGIAYWGLCRYLEIGSINGAGPTHFYDYVYFSAITFTTLGFGDLVPSGHLRLLAGVEGLNGLILIAWSASFTYLAMERYWPQHAPSLRRRLVERHQPADYLDINP